MQPQKVQWTTRMISGLAYRRQERLLLPWLQRPTRGHADDRVVLCETLRLERFRPSLNGCLVTGGLYDLRRNRRHFIEAVEAGLHSADDEHTQRDRSHRSGHHFIA
jgi:hypothetical protein